MLSISPTWDWRGRVVGLLLIALTVLAWCPALDSAIVLPKRVALHALAGVALLLARRISLRRGMLTALAVGAVAISTLVSGAVMASAPRAFDEVAALVLALAISSACLRRSSVTGALVMAATLAALLGLVEGWVHFPLLEATRPASVFGGRNAAGELVAAVLPLAAIWASARRLRWHGLIAIVLLTAFLVTTRCRAAWVGAALGLAIALWRCGGRQRLAVIAAVALGVATAGIFTPGPLIQWRSAAPYSESLASMIAPKFSDRITTWENTLSMLGAHPMGVGPGRFRARYPEFSRKLAPDPSFGVSLQIEEPHNEFLRLAVELGIPGALLVMAALWPRRRRGRSSSRTMGLVGSLAALTPPAMVSVTFTSPPALAVAAIVLGLLARGRDRGVRNSGPRIAGLVFLAGAMVFDLASVASSRAMVLGAQAQRAGWLREACTQFANSARWSGSAAPLLQEAEASLAGGDIRRCKSATADALGIEPNSLHALHLMAVCASKSGDSNAATQNYRRALSLLPGDYVALLGLARLSPQKSRERHQFAESAAQAAEAELALLQGSHGDRPSGAEAILREARRLAEE